MKIVFVSDAIYPYLHGGKEKRLYELSTRLAQMGHDVHIYTMHWWKSSAKTRTEDGVHLHAISKYYEMYSGDRRTIKEGVMFGLACFKLFFVKFDVLDVDHMPFFPILSAWAVCLFTFRLKKFYGTWHEALSRKEWLDYMGAAGNIASLIERICIQLPHDITAASAKTQKSLKLQRGKKNKVHLVTPGIDYSAIQAVTPAKVNCDVLTVCRLVKDKNVDVLIGAIAILAEKNPKINCTVVGTGLEEQRLKKLTKQSGITKNITFISRLPKAYDVYSYMKAAKVFCLPTVREGFGIVTLEALACDTPVVTIDVASNTSRELIENGKNGSKVALDKHAVAEAIQYWLNRKQTKFSGATQTVTKYDWDELAKKQAKVYST